MYKRILVTTDGSGLSKKAVASAIGLAQCTGGELVALHVVPRYHTDYFEGGVAGLSPQDIGRIEKSWAEQGRAMVDAVHEAAEAAGVKTRATVVTSDLVAESIIAAARKHKCDLIVMASHGRKGIKRVLLGSETQNVLAASTVPVLVLR